MISYINQIALRMFVRIAFLIGVFASATILSSCFHSKSEPSLSNRGVGMADAVINEIIQESEYRDYYSVGFQKVNGRSVTLITKYDFQRQVTWQKEYIKGENTFGFTIVGNIDYIYVGGFFYEKNKYYAFLLKYDTDGTLLWERIYPGETEISAYYKLALESVGPPDESYIYAVGEVVNNDQFDTLIVKYNAAGELIWESRHGNETDDEAAYAATLRYNINNQGFDLIVGGMTLLENSNKNGWISRINKENGTFVGNEHMSPNAQVESIEGSYSSDDLFVGYTVSDGTWQVRRLSPDLSTNVWENNFSEIEGNKRLRKIIFESYPEEKIYAVGHSELNDKYAVQFATINPIDGSLISQHRLNVENAQVARSADLSNGKMVIVGWQELDKIPDLLFTCVNADDGYLKCPDLIQASSYRSFEQNSPFSSIDFSQGYFHLENFEDGQLNIPGVTSNVLIPTIVNSHSVDNDDGVIDGQCADCLSFLDYCPSEFIHAYISFSFDETILGELPTHVGLVWTDDVSSSLRIEVNTKSGHYETYRPADIAGSGVDNDTFFGFNYAGGIQSISITHGSHSNFAELEIDHLQFGNTN